MRIWLTATGAVYASGALDFLLRPKAATTTLSNLGEPIEPETPPGLYNGLASAYMATIAALALRAGRDPRAHADLIPPLLVAKATSSLALLYHYQRTHKTGFAVAAGLDAVLFGVTAGLYAAENR